MNRAKGLLGVWLLVLAVTGLTFGQEKKAKEGFPAGTWDCVAHLSGEDDIPFTMKLDQSGETVTGSVTTHDGALEIKSGTYKNGMLELHLESPDAKYLVTGRLDGEQFKGQWSKDPDGMQGDWEGKRSAATSSSGS
jgi:hypothetical protein